MWLINTGTLKLEAVPDPEHYSYAILSHTWKVNEEVSFQEFTAPDREPAKKKAGFSKIERTCQLAKSRNLSYAWVDTCCIDKTNGAELTEAINSMFRWYKQSAVCFVYLSDLITTKDAIDAEFPRCRWFRRGWTLQELIAPKKIEFYDMNWIHRGDKNDQIMKTRLFKATGIDGGILEDSDLLPTVPVAMRMSWASDRHTSKEEDLAYSLFGIFDINLPLIYGEGKKAFLRLQEAIVQENSDLSLFAWTSQDRNEESPQEYRGIFARSPSEFKRCNEIKRITNPVVRDVELSITNKGVLIKTRLIKGEKQNTREKDYLLNLDCADTGRRQADGTHHMVCIRLVQTAKGFVRHDLRELVLIDPAHVQPILELLVYIPKTLTPTESRLLTSRLGQRFYKKIENEMPQLNFTSEITPDYLWDQVNDNFITDGHEDFTALIDIKFYGTRMREDIGRCLVVFGLEADGSPGALKPWAAVYEIKPQLPEEVCDIFLRGPKLDCEYVLRQVRRVLRSRDVNGETLPTTLTCKGVPISESDFAGETLCSINVNVSTIKKDPNSYELVVSLTDTPDARRPRPPPREGTWDYEVEAIESDSESSGVGGAGERRRPWPDRPEAQTGKSLPSHDRLGRRVSPVRQKAQTYPSHRGLWYGPDGPTTQTYPSHRGLWYRPDGPTTQTDNSASRRFRRQEGAGG